MDNAVSISLNDSLESIIEHAGSMINMLENKGLTADTQGACILSAKLIASTAAMLLPAATGMLGGRDSSDELGLDRRTSDDDRIRRGRQELRALRDLPREGRTEEECNALGSQVAAFVKVKAAKKKAYAKGRKAGKRRSRKRSK